MRNRTKKGSSADNYAFNFDQKNVSVPRKKTESAALAKFSAVPSVDTNIESGTATQDLKKSAESVATLVNISVKD